MLVLGRFLLALAFLAVIPAGACAAGNMLTREYDLKAAFLFHFAAFVEWPPEALPDRGAPLVIGILGDDPFGTSIDEIVANEVVNGHRLAVRRVHSAAQAESCQILYIASSGTRLQPKALQQLGRGSVLTVGDGREFAVRSGIIGFVLSGKRLRLAVNLAAARAARLTISSKLLRQSEIVGPTKAGE